MRKGIVRAISVMLLGAMLFSGCGMDSKESEMQLSMKDEISIGLSFDSFVIERWVRDRDAFVAAAEELGATVNIQCANGSVEEQIEQVRYLIEKRVDVIVIIPVDCYKVADVISEARAAGIKVISYDRLCEKSNCDLYVSFDNEEVGHIMGQEVIKKLPDGGKICIIGGPLTDGNVARVEAGFQKETEGRLEVVYIARCNNWVANEATGYVQEAFKKNPDIKAIMCGNDDIATQVYQVLSANQLSGEIYLTGQDGDLMAFQRVASGTQLVSVFKPVDEIARKAAECAVKLAKGEKLDNISETINDGKYDIPFLEIMPIGVNCDNIDEIVIDGGYHTKEEIYINK